MYRVAVLGGGSWGLAISKLLSENGHLVKVWEYNPDYVQEILDTRCSNRFLPGVVFPDSIFFSNSLQEVVDEETEILIIAVPSEFVRETVKNMSFVLNKLKTFPIKSIINLAKGIDFLTHQRMSEVISNDIPGNYLDLICTLSGPSHAEEVARHIPTTVVIAGRNKKVIELSQSIFSNEYFRVYTTPDITGVEIGGAVKNIIAIAAGIIDGLELGDNTKGALLTRGLAEIKRLGLSLGADPKTFYGLSGIGDLVTTAISKHSRNRFVGYELGKGRKLKEIQDMMSMVAEGVNTAKAVYRLKNKLGVDMPITDQVYAVLFEEKNVIEAIKDLMTRDLKEED